MNVQVFKQVKESIYELLYAKVVKAFENASLSYGAVIKLPALTDEDWINISVVSSSAGLFFNYAAREMISELLDIDKIYKNAVHNYLINECKIHELPGEFYHYNVIRDCDGGILTIIR